MTRGEDGEAVKEFDVTITVLIRAWEVDGVTKYDWIHDSGDSDELYETIDEAVAAAVSSLGG